MNSGRKQVLCKARNQFYAFAQGCDALVQGGQPPFLMDRQREQISIGDLPVSDDPLPKSLKRVGYRKAGFDKMRTNAA